MKLLKKLLSLTPGQIKTDVAVAVTVAAAVGFKIDGSLSDAVTIALVSAAAAVKAALALAGAARKHPIHVHLDHSMLENRKHLATELVDVVLQELKKNQPTPPPPPPGDAKP